MNCPVCKSDSVDERGTGAAILNNKAWMCRCIDCRTQFTTWQQDQLTTKDREIAGLKANSSAEMRETLMHQLMTCADEKDALLKKLDDYRQYVNVGHYDDLEKELAEAYSKIDAMNKEGADSLASAGGACMHLQEQLAESQRVCEKWECTYRLSERIASDRCTELAEARQEIKSLSTKLSLCERDYSNISDEMTKHLGRPFTSHGTDAVIILLHEISDLKASIETVWDVAHSAQKHWVDAIMAYEKELADRDKRILVLNAELTGCIKDAEYQEKDLIDTRIELSSARQTTEEVRKLMLVQTEYYLKAESNYDYEIDRLKAEFATVKEDLEDGNAAYRHVMEEKCAGDEMHCTCVPHLRRGIAELKSELGKCKEELKKLQYMPTEDSCEIPEHDETGDDDEHNNSCCGCGRYKCQGCKPDCWLAALLKED
jgi:hypothetical protein